MSTHHGSSRVRCSVNGTGSIPRNTRLCFMIRMFVFAFIVGVDWCLHAFSDDVTMIVRFMRRALIKFLIMFTCVYVCVCVHSVLWVDRLLFHLCVCVYMQCCELTGYCSNTWHNLLLNLHETSWHQLSTTACVHSKCRFLNYFFISL